jgi:hypothetical protein
MKPNINSIGASLQLLFSIHKVPCLEYKTFPNWFLVMGVSLKLLTSKQRLHLQIKNDIKYSLIYMYTIHNHFDELVMKSSSICGVPPLIFFSSTM